MCPLSAWVRHLARSDAAFRMEKSGPRGQFAGAQCPQASLGGGVSGPPGGPLGFASQMTEPGDYLPLLNRKVKKYS